MPTNMKLYYHSFWEVKDLERKITEPYVDSIKLAITSEMLSLKIVIICLTLLPDHVHILYAYEGELGVPNIIKQIKGGSSHALNSNGIVPNGFHWAKSHNSYSVSRSKLDDVIAYLNDQEEYHKEHGYENEVEYFKKVHFYG
jgi:putative transposase